MIARLRDGAIIPAGVNLDDGVLDVLHAAVEIIAGDGSVDAEGAVQDASRLHQFISAVNWPEPDFSERAELLQACSIWGWRLARRAGKLGAADVWARRLHLDERSVRELRHGFTKDIEGLRQHLEEPEILLGICAELRARLDASPLVVVDEAGFYYAHLSEPKGAIGLFDEREYFLGELALLAGSAARALAHREECPHWFALAEANFRFTMNAVADWSRVSYQRLALLLEERKFDDLMDQLPILVKRFESLGMDADVLKCRSLEGLALMETGQLSKSGAVFESVRQEARRLGHERLIASAGVNLVHVFSQQGAAEEALACAREVLPLLRKLDHRIAIAQVQVGIGSLLRARSQMAAALDAYRSGIAEYRELGMLADVAATRLVVADLLMATGQEPLAVQEILTAIPVIEEYRMVPEGKAALALLREAIRGQKVDRQALRDLHRFFEDSVS